MKNLAVTVVALTIVLAALTLMPAFGQVSSNVSVFATGLNTILSYEGKPGGY